MGVPMCALLLLSLGSDSGERPALRTRLSVRQLDPSALRELGMPATFAQGDRIVVPRSAFETLRKRGAPSRGFRLGNKDEPGRQFFTEAAPTHCAEGTVCVPAFVLSALGVRPGETVVLESAHFPKAAYVRFQAHSSKLAEHPEMEAMLTSTLEGFAALTNGTTIELREGPNVYKVDVIAVRARPDRRADGSRGAAVWIDNIDLVTDWAAPKDAQRAARRKRAAGGGGAVDAAADEGAAAAADDDAADEAGADGAPAKGGGRAAAPLAFLSAETFAAAGLTPLDALRDMVVEQVRADPVAQLLALDVAVARYVLARALRLALNALRWLVALELLPPVGVAAKDRSKFAHAEPAPAELMALRLQWLGHATKAVLGFALALPAAEPFAWHDAVKERSYGGRYGFLGGWSAPWLEGWPYKGVFPASWAGKAGERRWRDRAAEL